jgi:hypothetical protein
MDETIPKKKDFLVPSLPLVEEATDKAKVTDVIEFLVKQRAGSTATGATYKMKVQRFNEGTVSEWIAVRKSIKELWVQNSIASQADRVANVCSILRGESLTGFEEKIEELTHVTAEDGTTNTIPLSDVIVEGGLNAVAKTTFPHRALETQKLWMRRGMKKPKELSFRKTAAAVGRLNNCLPLFPGGSDLDKFSTTEIVELLEWSIPKAWRTKFDLDGYVPTSHSKDRLISECEAIERNLPKWNSSEKPASKSTVHKKNRGIVKHKNVDSKKDSTKSYYCTEHGKNPTHATENCYVVKNKAAKANASNGKTLTKQSFRREINIMSKTRSKKKILEMFATVLSDEHRKMPKSKKTKAHKTKDRDVRCDSSDSEESAESTNEQHAMEIDHDVKKNETDEEQTYRECIETLGTIIESK